MSDTPRTDARLGYENQHHGANMLCREFERELNQAIKERDENKAGWDRASLTALNLEQRIKRAEKCIDAIEAHYKSKHGESYDHTTLNTIITNWRDNANTLQN